MGLQLSFLLLAFIALVFLLDNRYRVLPNRLHEWSPIHHPGHVITDITMTTCSSLSVLSSCTMGGDWARIEKDLYLGSGWVSHAYIHVQRKREEDLQPKDRVLLDVHVGRLDPGAEKLGKNEKWESRPGGIWLLRTSDLSAFDNEEAVTAVDVLFGADAVEPRPGWLLKDQSVAVDVDAHTPEPRLSIRRGPYKTPEKPVPRINSQGKFKILQVSDLHLSTGLGRCRDEFPQTSHCDADPRTLEFVAKTLDVEQPDLVVLSGDQVNGETAPDAQTAMFKMADIFADRKIPFALIFGNHDDEGSLTRQALMQLAETLPFSLTEPGPATVDGVGNYYLEILAKGTSSHSAITLFLLDTHSYSPEEKRYRGYDWLKPSQLSWFRETAAALRNSPSHKGYTHHHLDMAFIHIPLPEYRDTDKIVSGSGEMREPPTAPLLNTGFKDALVENGVFAVSCGHDHANDYCAVDRHSDPETISAERGEEAKRLAREGQVWMCYGGGSGYGGYGGYGGYKRRLRVWDFQMTGSVETWIRIDGEESRSNIKRVMERGAILAT